MKNVLLLHESLPFHGGVPRSFLWLARRLPQGPFHFGSLESTSDSILTTIESEGSPVVSFGSRNPAILIPRVRRYLKANRIEAVFACSFRSYYVAKAAAVWLGCEVVFWIRDIVVARSIPKRILFLLITSRKDWLIANAGATLRSLASEKRERTGIVYGGVEIKDGKQKSIARLCLDLPESATVLLYAAEYQPYKDHGTLIKAFCLLAGQWPDLYLVLCGREGGLREDIDKLVPKDHPACERIRIYGARNDMENFYAAADIYAHPCYIEAFGNAVVEAMVAGLPVVAARGGGMPEVVGDAGILVEPRSPEAMARAIQGLLRDPSARSTLAMRGAERARREFTIEAYADRFLNVCSSILDDRAFRAATRKE